jgi:Zn-dependent protease with chaperone function
LERLPFPLKGIASFRLYYCLASDLMSLILKVLFPIGAFMLAACTAFATNWLALIPWRNSKGRHWSEQARLLYPAAMAARTSIWAIPAIVTLIIVLVWPDASLVGLLTGTFSILGAYTGTSFMYREVFARISKSEIFRSIVIGSLLQMLGWLVFISAAVCMPKEFNLLAWSIGGVVMLFWIFWSRYGWLWMGKKMGLYLPAPERLSKIVAETSIKMKIPYGEVLLIRSPFCQAYAVFNGRKLLFTERLLEVAPNEEIAAICVHELAHLSESKMVRLSRSIRMLTYLPWVFFNPLLHTFGMIAFLGLFMIAIFIPRIYGSMSRKLEVRADSLAQANEQNPGVYAQALVRLYEDNLTPAVTSKRRSTHPALYDRLLAAGMKPDFSRPAAPMAMAWHGKMFSWLAWLLFGILAIRVVQSP